MRSVVRRLLLLSAAVFAAFTVAGLLASPAAAQITGPCTGTINFSNFAYLSPTDSSDHITVDRDAVVAVTMSTSLERITHYRIALEFLDHRWTVADHDTDSTGWSDAVNVRDYAKYGVGLYKVVAESDRNGAVVCTAVGFVDVDADWFGTGTGKAAAGMGAVGLAGLSLAGLAAASPDPKVREDLLEWERIEKERQAEDLRRYQREAEERRREEKEGCFSCSAAVLPALLLTMTAMIGGGTPTVPGSVQAGTPPPHLRRMHWRPRLSALGIVSSLVGAVGVLTLLQQSGRVFPTLNVGIYTLVAAVLVGVGLPSLLRLVAVRRTNRMLEGMERRFAELTSPQSPAGVGPRLPEPVATESSTPPPPPAPSVPNQRAGPTAPPTGMP